MECSHCHAVMDSGDLFCGDCGTPLPPPPALTGAQAGSNGNGRWPATGRTVPRQASAAHENGSSGPFFSHARTRPAGRMTNATRYLCAAAYLDAGYAATVIRELVASVWWNWPTTSRS